MADETLILSETQKYHEQQTKLKELQAYANMLNTPDLNGNIGVVTDLTAVMRIQYNDGSSTRIHTSDAFNTFFTEFVKANAPELMTRTVQKALEMVKEQQVKAAKEVQEQLNIGISEQPAQPTEGAPVFTGPMVAVAYAGDEITYYANAASLPASVITFEAEDLPEGVTIDGNSGLISGVIAESGTYSIKLKATNAVGTTTKILTLTIAEKSKPNATGPSAPVVYGQLNVTATEETPFMFQCGATNLPETGNTWEIVAPGALPDGLSLDADTGLITGTPASGTAGTYSLTLKVTTASGDWDTGMYNLTVKAVSAPEPAPTPAPSIINIPNRIATIGTAFYQQCAALNLPSDHKWDISGQPSSISIDASTGKITGTPATGEDASSPYTVTVSIKDAGGAVVDSKSFTLTVNPS